MRWAGLGEGRGVLTKSRRGFRLLHGVEAFTEKLIRALACLLGLVEELGVRWVGGDDKVDELAGRRLAAFVHPVSSADGVAVWAPLGLVVMSGVTHDSDVSEVGDNSPRDHDTLLALHEVAGAGASDGSETVLSLVKTRLSLFPPICRG